MAQRDPLHVQCPRPAIRASASPGIPASRSAALFRFLFFRFTRGAPTFRPTGHIVAHSFAPHVRRILSASSGRSSDRFFGLFLFFRPLFHLFYHQPNSAGARPAAKIRPAPASPCRNRASARLFWIFLFFCPFLRILFLRFCPGPHIFYATCTIIAPHTTHSYQLTTYTNAARSPACATRLWCPRQLGRLDST